ncbi:hypothetical protein EJ06DRAFT_513610 [Trichodelitschia bisporula]|uniref:Cytosolic regulator pianissimo n=1 Tax=Trichodelitschia bisporula TaxID=703511 RepID=A0A6G1HRI6_9PEZI|nr:hypothetical protein EJ06DRAFT_513610 [Trichodelitschia bisporula]
MMPPPNRVPASGASSVAVSQADATPTLDQANYLQPALRYGRDARSMSSAGAYPPRNQSLATAVQPASFAPASFRSETPRPDFGTAPGGLEEDARSISEKRQAEIRSEIEKETKIKTGSENLLEALNSKNAKQFKEQKLRAEAELNMSNRKLAELRAGLEQEIMRSKESQPANEGRLSFIFNGATPRPLSRQTFAPVDPPLEESPTFALAELLQAIETDDMSPECYVDASNRLVDLFKLHPTLRYDLDWTAYGPCLQRLLFNESREVIAASYRVLRHSITDRRSLQTIRALNTDILVISSLVKESKASVEREQALNFVRSFLDIKDGVHELSRGVVRIIVAIAEHGDDRLRNIAILTLAEILTKKPEILVAAGGLGTLTDALGDGNYRAAPSLTSAFVFLLDIPSRRRFLRSGHELETPLASFTEGTGHTSEEKLKTCASVIAALLRSWPGLIALSVNNFLAIRSLVECLYIELPQVRNTLLELLTDILRIKPPSWSSSFVAGRRLTTYARVTNLKSEVPPAENAEASEERNQRNLVEHFTAVVLAVLLHAGLMEALLYAEERPLSPALRRKTTLVLGEVLKLSNEMLPSSWSAKLQVLPGLIRAAARFDTPERFVAIGTIYQVDSVNRTLYRSDPSTAVQSIKLSNGGSIEPDSARQADQTKAQQGMQVDETHFRTMMLESGVLATINFTKWRWDVIQSIIDGPLRNPKRLDEAIRSTKFLHRIVGFYRPFKYRFSMAKNTKPNQRYVRVGCALMQALLANQEGVRYLGESKLVRQLGECLSQIDRLSGFTSETPLFSADRMTETLTGGYFAMLGAMTKDIKGLQILERWKIFNMFYHIVELQDRDDLIRALLGGLSYAVDSHLRILLSKAMTSGSKPIRIFATRLLRKYACSAPTDASDTPSTIEWAIRLLVTQLYDPEIEVCEVAIKILEESCHQKHSLEYIVKCRPALDHLGEIGAPLLLRFLSTSVGYKYLDELDYITREMDDWFLGRNDSYVALIEASLARALMDVPPPALAPNAWAGMEEAMLAEVQEYGVVPPHFYRELTRTTEGCRLLEQKGHFDEFVSTIREFGMEEEDEELLVKVKGCLWAVGNVGSMELGAPFLESSDVVRWIVRIAEGSAVMTMRGTAFYVLGLISRSLHGQEILLELGWDGTVNMRGESLGFCMPIDFKKLFSIKPWSATHDPSPSLGTMRPRSKGSVPKDPTEARILLSVSNLGNTVLAKKAMNDLHGFKSKYPTYFHSRDFFNTVMRVLEEHHFRLPLCRFVLDLFDRKVMRQIVLKEEEEKSDEKESTSEEEEEEEEEKEKVEKVVQSKLSSSEEETETDDDDDDDAESTPESST